MPYAVAWVRKWRDRPYGGRLYVVPLPVPICAKGLAIRVSEPFETVGDAERALQDRLTNCAMMSAG